MAVLLSLPRPHRVVVLGSLVAAAAVAGLVLALWGAASRPGDGVRPGPGVPSAPAVADPVG